MNPAGSGPRRWVTALPLAALLTLTAACTGSGGASAGPSGAAGGPPVRGGSATVGISDAIDSWNPQLAELTVSYEVFPQVYGTLLRPGSVGKKLQPGLASSYTYDGAAKKITFRLDPRAKFSNGNAVTSADVKFSFGIWRAGEIYGSYYKSVRSVSTPNPHTAVFHLSEADATLPEVLATTGAAIVPNHYAGESAKAYWKQPISAGPFKIASQVQGQSINLVRNPYYYRPGLPRLDKLNFHVVTDDNQNLLQFQSGALDIVNNLNTAVAGQYSKDRIVASPSSGVSVLISQTKLAPTDNADFRKGLSLAIDYKSLLAGGYSGEGVKATSVLPQVVPGVQPCDGCHWSTTDVARAKQLVAASGYHGQKLEILVATGSPEQLAAQAMVPMLAKAGITAGVTAVPLSSQIDRLGKGNFQLGMLSASALAATPLDPLGLFAGTDFLFSKVSVAPANTAIKAIHGASNEAEVAAAVKTFERFAYDSAAVIPLVVPNADYAVSSKVQGFKPDPYLEYVADELWVTR